MQPIQPAPPGKTTVTGTSCLLVAALCASLPALAVEPGLHEEMAVIGANTVGYNMAYAAIACHAPADEVAAYTARAKVRYAAAPDFDGAFARGQSEGAKLANDTLRMAATDPGTQAALARQCVQSLARLKTP